MDILASDKDDKFRSIYYRKIGHKSFKEENIA